jgi:hypothetical protein
MPLESTEFVQPPVVLPDDAAPSCRSTVTEKRKRGRPPKASTQVPTKKAKVDGHIAATMKELAGKARLHCREIYHVLFYSYGRSN